MRRPPDYYNARSNHKFLTEVIKVKQDHYDVAVIGSGIAGMCAAALLAHSGYSVLVVEKLPQLGGRCSTIEYKGYKIPHVAQERPLAEWGGIDAAIFKEVGADFDVIPLPPIVYRIKGTDYQAPEKGQFAFLLSQCCKDEAEFDRVRTALRRARTWTEPSSSISFLDWILQYTDNELVIALLENFLCALLMMRANEVSARDVIGFYRVGLSRWGHTGRPRRGNIALMESLAETIRGRGGDVWTHSPAKQILTAEGVVKGIVVDKKGDEIEIAAKAVISNTGPKETAELVGKEKLDKGYMKELKENLHHGSQMLIAFASHRPLIEYAGGLATVGGRRVLHLSCLTLTCPELSPPGKYLHTAQCQPRSQFAPLNPSQEIEAAIEDLRENLPGFDKDAEVLHIACMFNPDWPGYRNLSGYYLPQKTPIENLYNVGDGVPFFPEGPYAVTTSRPVVDDLKNRIKPEEG